MPGKTEARWRIHPVSLCQFVSPFLFLSASHLVQIVRTPLGTAGRESMHGWDSMRESVCSVYECLSACFRLQWDKSLIFALPAVSQTQWSFCRRVGRAGGRRKWRKRFLRVLPRHISCAEVNHISGKRRSVSRACSRAAQHCQPGCLLEAQQMEASPETRAVSSICWTLRISLFDGLTAGEAWCLFCTVYELLEINHLSMKHTKHTKS